MRAAQIDNDGNVVNVIMLPDDFSEGEWDGLQIVQTDEAGPGWTWDGSAFSAPPEPEEPA